MVAESRATSKQQNAKCDLIPLTGMVFQSDLSFDIEAHVLCVVGEASSTNDRNLHKKSQNNPIWSLISNTQQYSRETILVLFTQDKTYNGELMATHCELFQPHNQPEMEKMKIGSNPSN